jgi:hypothetical protein
MNPPSPLPRTEQVEIIRAQTEATRARAEAGKAIVATVFRGLLPLGVFGIAAGATAIVVERADPNLHLAGLLVIWICATVFSTVAILSGLLERRPLPGLRRLLGDDTIQLEIDEAKRLRHSYQE